jgi:hypothetical protein
LPSQTGQRLTAPALGYLGLLRIVASCLSCVGTRWCSLVVRRRSWRRGEESLQGRNGLPDPVACRDIVRRASLSCAVSAREATDFRAGTNPVCRTDGDVLQTAGLVAVGLDLFNWDRGHPVTCNRLVRSAARLRGSGRQAQSYVGKRAVLKGVTGAYGSLGCLPGPPGRITRSACKQLTIWGNGNRKTRDRKKRTAHACLDVGGR